MTHAHDRLIRSQQIVISEILKLAVLKAAYSMDQFGTTMTKQMLKRKKMHIWE